MDDLLNKKLKKNSAFYLFLSIFLAFIRLLSFFDGKILNLSFVSFLKCKIEVQSLNIQKKGNKY